VDDRRTLILAIETSNPSAWTAGQAGGPGVALGRILGGTLEVLGVEAVDPKRPHDSGLMPAIDRLMKSRGFQARDLGSIAVSVGPGGFTAVRIAVTTAKLIAEATGAACVAIPSAAVVARRVRAVDGGFAIALGSKDHSTFLTRFDAHRIAAAPGAIVTAADLDVSLACLVADRFLPEEMRRRAGELGIHLEAPVFDPTACLEASVGIDPVDPVALLPLYPREAEAVTKWRALKAARGE
jgi:tRNA threonylcarbamoyl adenosine modification protein YeaZ